MTDAGRIMTGLFSDACLMAGDTDSVAEWPDACPGKVN